VPVSLSGLPVDLAPLQDLRRDGLIVIEDACHALGGARGGRPVGGDGMADMYAFSLHPVKSITTGEGGVIATDSDELADRLRTFRTHSIERGGNPDDVLQGGWHYDVTGLGFNYRITDFQCALGESQLKRLRHFVDERNRVAALYRERLAAVDGLSLPAEPAAGDVHAYHLFVVRFREGAERRRQAYEHLRERGVGTQLHYIPIYRHSLYRGLGYDDELPGAEAYYREALSLPMFPAMTEADVDRVVEALQSALAQDLPDAAASNVGA
jgi:dTDP-4-amino-4,6-dideoxygalactose transaminase